MSERAAFLRAIAEQPADRTARLVFADFLEETGDAARAAFVRAQVEADTAHPNSNRRAELEIRARELFAEHWLDWWAPVCAAVKLPLPRRASGLRGWVARRLARQSSAGFPYTRSKGAPGIGIIDLEHGPPLDVLYRIQFRGGFPEALSFIGQPGFAAEFLRRWTDVSPLAELDLHGIVARDWHAIDGPHLHGLQTLDFGHSGAAGLAAVGASPHLTQLETLRLDPDRSNIRWPTEQYRAFADSALAGRITRLSVVLADVSEALAFHGAPLSDLTALEVRAPRSLSTREEFDRATLATLDLLSLPHLDHVEELTLDAVTSPALERADRTLLGRLRKLELAGNPFARFPLVLDVWALAPALADLSLAIENWSVRHVTWLTQSSVVGQLRHLRLDGSLAPSQDAVVAMMQLVRALDANRLETLRMGEAVCPSPAVRATLAEKFSARVRFG